MLPRLLALGAGQRRFSDLNEKEILAGAISSEEEDSRIYAALRDHVARKPPQFGRDVRRHGGQGGASTGVARLACSAGPSPTGLPLGCWPCADDAGGLVHLAHPRHAEQIQQTVDKGQIVMWVRFNDAGADRLPTGANWFRRRWQSHPQPALDRRARRRIAALDAGTGRSRR